MNSTTATSIRPGFDTNILIYSFDLRDRHKHNVARTLVRRCAEMDGVLSIQCLTEFYRATTRKKILSQSLAFDAVELTRASFEIISPSEEDLLRAMQDHAIHKVQFFDALMRTTLNRGGCTLLFSEDFSHGDTFRKLRIINPFKLSVTELDQLLA